MRITYSYGLVGDPEDIVRTVVARRPSIHAAEAHFEIGLVGEFARGEMSITVLDWILHDAHTRSVKSGETNGCVSLVWSEFAAGEINGALEWAEATEMDSGNPRSAEQ